MRKPSLRRIRRHLPLSYTGRSAALAVAATLVVILVAACGSSTNQASTGAGAQPSPKHPVTLVVENDDGGEPGLVSAYAALNKKFEAAHPGVKVKFEVKRAADLLATVKLQLSGSSVPDAVQTNQGYSALGALVTDGLVKNLDSIAAADHWSARQPASLLALDGRFSSDGKTMGSGSLWGISATGTWVGVFENTALAKQLGIKGPPKTLTQFEQDMATAKAHGVVPMAMGTSDAYEPLWTIYELIMAEAQRPQILSSITDGTSSTLPSAMTEAAKTFQSWQNAGYFTPGASGYQASDAVQKFVSGNGLFVVDGSWDVPLSGPPSETSKFRMILFPLGDASPLGAVATGDQPWSIPTHAAHPQLAAEYINYITSPAADSAWIAAGQVPASGSGTEVQDAAQAHLQPASRDALSGWNALLKRGYFEPYIDWATPTFLTDEQQSVQDLLGGKISPSGYTSALQAGYGQFVKQRDG